MPISFAKMTKPAVATKTKAEDKPKARSWMKRGDAAAAVMEEEEERIKKMRSRTFRFFMEKEGEGRITFVDGKLTPKGLLDIYTYREHHVKLNGKWGNFFPCVAEEEPCPLCLAGNNAPVVGLLTVIDHREVITKRAKYPYTRKLFVAKLSTLKILQQLASKRGGLINCTFDVSRQGEQAPNVGNVFDFVERVDPAAARKKFVRKDPESGKMITLYAPIEYETEIEYKTAAQLKRLGFSAGVGDEKGMEEDISGGGTDDGEGL